MLAKLQFMEISEIELYLFIYLFWIYGGDTGKQICTGFRCTML